MRVDCKYYNDCRFPVEECNKDCSVYKKAITRDRSRTKQKLTLSQAIENMGL